MTTGTIAIEEAREQTVAAVIERVPQGKIGTRVRPNLDKVYSFLTAYPEYRLGHASNILIYPAIGDAAADGLITVAYGVEAERPFPPAGVIVCTATPAGRIATAVHTGPYDRLGETNTAITQWCRANGHALAGISWEIYGDWNEDPAKLETKVCYLLR